MILSIPIYLVLCKFYLCTAPEFHIILHIIHYILSTCIPASGSFSCLTHPSVIVFPIYAAYSASALFSFPPVCVRQHHLFIVFLFLHKKTVITRTASTKISFLRRLFSVHNSIFMRPALFIKMNARILLSCTLSQYERSYPFMY